MIDENDRKTAPLIPRQVIAYLRVSTDAQDVDNQLHGIKAYAAAHGLNIDQIFKDSISGTTPWQKRGIGAIVAGAAVGEIILVAEISRLARSTLQVLEILQAVALAGQILHVVKSNLIMDGSLQSKITATILGLAAEIEREFIVARTTEALAKRKEAGLPMGRPVGEAKKLRLDEIASNIDGWHAKKLGMRSIAKLAECSPGTLYAWVARRRPEWRIKNEQ